MPPSQLTPPILIKEVTQLEAVAHRLAAEHRVAVDTESNSLHAYREQVCLVQFSTDTEDLIVDPLALPSLEPLAPLFADSQIELVFHAAEYDLMTLKRDFGFRVRNLFDTQIACRTLGWKRTGLASILEREFGVQLNKRFQRADWGRRPLGPELLDYARLDTHYLLPLRDRLERELQEADLWPAASEAFQWQAKVEAANHQFDQDGFWRIKDAHRLQPAELTALRELYLYRDEQARRLNRPPFKVFTDPVILAIARAQPQDLDALRDLKGMSAGQIARYGEGILAALERAAKAAPPKRPKNQRVDDAILERFDTLRQWRKRVARSRKIESDVVLPRDVLWQIARRPPKNEQELWALMNPLEWRFRTFGEEILSLFRT